MSEPRVCPACAAENLPEAVFCARCGHALETEVEPHTPAAEEPMEADAEPTPEATEPRAQEPTESKESSPGSGQEGSEALSPSTRPADEHSEAQTKGRVSRVIGWTLIVVALVALGARGYLAIPGYLAERVTASVESASVRVQLPKIKIRDPLGTLSSTVVVDLELKIINDSLLPLTLSHLDYALQLEGREVAKGLAELADEALPLPAGEETTVRLESQLDLQNIGLAGVDVLKSERLAFDITGSVEAGVGPIQVRREYRIEGHPFAVLKPKLF